MDTIHYGVRTMLSFSPSRLRGHVFKNCLPLPASSAAAANLRFLPPVCVGLVTTRGKRNEFYGPREILILYTRGVSIWQRSLQRHISSSLSLPLSLTHTHSLFFFLSGFQAAGIHTLCPTRTPPSDIGQGQLE
jgi:hypothetical protein